MTTMGLSKKIIGWTRLFAVVLSWSTELYAGARRRRRSALSPHHYEPKFHLLRHVTTRMTCAV